MRVKLAKLSYFAESGNVVMPGDVGIASNSWTKSGGPIVKMHEFSRLAEAWRKVMESVVKSGSTTAKSGD